MKGNEKIYRGTPKNTTIPIPSQYLRRRLTVNIDYNLSRSSEADIKRKDLNLKIFKR